MKARRYEHSPQMETLIKRFPRWTYYFGAAVFLFIAATIFAIGHYVRYTETLTVPMQITAASDSTLTGTITIPGTAADQLSTGQIIRFKTECQYSLAQDSDLEAMVVAIEKSSDNNCVITLYLPASTAMALGNLAQPSDFMDRPASFLVAEIPCLQVKLFDKLRESLKFNRE